MIWIHVFGDSNKYPKHMFCEEIGIKKPFLIYHSDY